MSQAVKEPQTDPVFPTKIQLTHGLPSWFSTLGVISALTLLAAMGIFYLGNFSNEAFWTDETATFWQSELAFPLTENGVRGIQAMFDSIRGGSADPGGFNVLLLAWISFFGTSVESLRTFAFLFFVLYVAFVVMLIRRFALPALIGSAVIAALLLENITPYYAFELRPYMPELAASVGFLVLTLYLLERCSGWSLAVFSAGVVILGASQYSAAVLSLTVGILILNVYRRLVKDSRSRLLLIAATVSIVWPVIQYSLLRGIPWMAGQQPPTHTIELLIRNQSLSQILDTLSVNFFSPTTLPRTAFILAVPLLWLFGKHALSRRSTQPARNAVITMWLYVLLGTTFSAALSIIGVMPWTLGTRWSINEIGFIAVSLVGLSLIAFEISMERMNFQIAQLSIAVLCILVVLLGSIRISTYSRPTPTDYLTSLAPDLFSGTPAGLIVDNWIYDDVRYLIEYSGRYPGLQDAWSAVKPRNSFGYGAATNEDITAFFLDKSADRLLLRNSEPIESVMLPDSIALIEPDSTNNGPVLLVKD